MQEAVESSGKPAPRRRAPKRSRPTWLIALLALIAALLVVVVAYLPRVSSPPPVRLPDIASAQAPHGGSQALRRGAVPQASPEPAARTTPSRPVASRSAAYRRIVGRGKLIFIIDDVGNDLTELKPFLSFPGPLTFSIMPQLPYTIEAYRLIVAAGKTPILHQPMEAEGPGNPGPGAIYTWMSRDEIDSLLTRNLEGMSAVRWVNNHMGSKVTSDLAAMTDVLAYLKAHNMHFLDSRTTRKTKVEAADYNLGLPYYHRNSYFLDDTVQRGAILQEIDAGLRLAQRAGYAVMVGHAWDGDLASILIELYPQLVAAGYQFADINALIGEVHSRAGSGN